ncbi:MAG: 4-alpha-glucanotransferase [Lachnospiraceae bacterium]|nr:4-alpha-glucanotransferase [Lachnospiraceae bacterium]
MDHTELEKTLEARHLKRRMSGVLVHPTSFPSPHGIGDMGQGARDFIDFLHDTGQHLWQVLPLGPTGFGDSPYQSLSAFAGQIYIISPEELKKEGLLTSQDMEDEPSWDPRKIDYGSVIEYKVRLLKKAFAHFVEIEAHTPAERNLEPTLSERFRDFCAAQAGWLDDYALFCALKDHFEGRCWLDWDPELREGRSAAKKAYADKLKQEIRYYKFTQFLFQEQWMALRLYAADRDVAIIGDIPIFMAIDNCDVWAEKKLFKLDPKGYPLEVAGVPPDYFSATGQLWGNPLYEWDWHEKTGFDWWIRRIARQLELVDYVRIDHFRGFVSYWAVPADAQTAIEGTWKEGPGEKLFLALQKHFGEKMPIIAEDLGVITEDVDALRTKFNFPGMKVLQFGFENMNDDKYLPHFYDTSNCVCYTGTHDNDTTSGWYQNQSEEVRNRIRIMGNCDGGGVSLDFIRFALGSVAKFAIFPIQDLLQMGSESRMNTPGVAQANWAFRYEQSDIDEPWRRDWLRRYTRIYDR